MANKPEAKKKKKLPRKYLIRRIVFAAICLLLVAGIVWGVVSGISWALGALASRQEESASEESESEIVLPEMTHQDLYASSESATDKAAWNLFLVNRDHRKDEEYVPELTFFENTGYRVHPGISTALTEMMVDAKNDGVIFEIMSSYRSYEVQKEKYVAKVEEISAEGWNQYDAPVRAGWEVSKPGESEHISGLAVDLVPRYEDYTLDINNFTSTRTYLWLVENCADYGFILRYPDGCEKHTMFYFEPWHFRYVGVEAAKEITERGICLEEYLDSLPD